MLLTKDALGEHLKPAIERNYNKKIDEMKSSASHDVQNDRSVFLIRLGRIEEAENILLSLIKKEPAKITPLLNIFRLYFLLDEYEIIREVFSDYLSKTKTIKNITETVLSELNKLKRFEERVILLDLLSNRKGWEIKALEELGLYFYGIGDYGNAGVYFEKILSANSFHPKALYYMAEISLETEKYSDAILYASNLLDEKNKEGSVYYLLVKANYELGKYKEALKWAEKAPESEKIELEFLSLWKNALLANNIFADISVLKGYFLKLQKKGLKIEEKDFFSEIYEKGTFRDIVHGK